jgi:hypothetical protein
LPIVVARSGDWDTMVPLRDGVPRRIEESAAANVRRRIALPHAGDA